MKKAVSVFVLFMLVLSTFSLAEEESSDNCAGFWNSLKCFLFGSAENRAGQGWFDRKGALVAN
ncbi:MAG TPA: hypothetical protein VJA23_04735 [Candidatus Nanoarchaeia archaeon]|nr:hypothetical protein [Candidatus Nanoarchaeia archaeon]